MAPTKELKPPPEVVAALNNEDTSNAEVEVSGFKSNVPRNIRNRLAHETPLHEVAKRNEDELPAAVPGVSKDQLVALRDEVKHTQEKSEMSKGHHPPAGGHKPEPMGNSSANIMGNQRLRTQGPQQAVFHKDHHRPGDI